MDFLNQFPNQTIAKDNASLFSFTEKEQKGDLPFAFGTQSSEAGEISFLNQMKSQDPGESFGLDGSQKNMGDLNFLKTIYECPNRPIIFLILMEKDSLCKIRLVCHWV